MYNKKGGHQIYEEKKFMEKSSLSGNVGGSRLFLWPDAARAVRIPQAMQERQAVRRRKQMPGRRQNRRQMTGRSLL